jgi:hypothetical protein
MMSKSNTPNQPDKAYESNIAYEALFVGALSSNKTIDENGEYGYVGKIINYHKDKFIHHRKHGSLSADIEKLNNEDYDIINIPIKPRFLLDNRNYSRATYSWVGFVSSIGAKTFRAKVEDLKSNNKVYEDAEFEINDLAEDEINMLKIGSVFYWSIGYEYRNGTKKKESFIRFKRLPKFTDNQIDTALDLSNELFDSLNWEE